MDPLDLESAVWVAERGARLSRRMQAMPERTAVNWPAHDELMEEVLAFNRLFEDVE